MDSIVVAQVVHASTIGVYRGRSGETVRENTPLEPARRGEPLEEGRKRLEGMAARSAAGT